MQLTKKPWAVCLMSAALFGGLGVSAQTTTSDPQTSPSRSFTTDLAKADLAEEGITAPTETQLSAAEESIQAMRDKGMGWGEIANSLGLNLGAVVSAANRAQPAAAKSAPNANRPTDSGQKSQTATATGRSDTGAGNSSGKGSGNSSGGGNGGGGNGGGGNGGGGGGNGGGGGRGK